MRQETTQSLARDFSEQAGITSSEAERVFSDPRFSSIVNVSDDELQHVRGGKGGGVTAGS